MAAKSKPKSVAPKKSISRYMGETEKSLDSTLKSAGKAQVVVLFDEADALLGKRTEVKDANDRYSNLETALNKQAAKQTAMKVIPRKVSKKNG